ncbi:hypothetical protein L6452_21773 [Arctium lappa]|uniref:Uncharacterized protein n=1 Tax=Arctium lappa TaxID=4217 RepID=A0ACB9AZM2_ARCLA|nr:hypothetical protein L6452_21773 [Arctium lappa]
MPCSLNPSPILRFVRSQKPGFPYFVERRLFCFHFFRSYSRMNNITRVIITYKCSGEIHIRDAIMPWVHGVSFLCS